MRSDKTGELPRQEAIRSWRRRREEDAEIRATYYDFDVVLRRLGEKVREHNSQRTVITLSRRGRIAVEKSAGNIVLDTRPFYFFRKKRAISFSDVGSLNTDYKRRRIHITGNGDTWWVSLSTGETGNRNIKIDRSSEEQPAIDLAEALGKLVGVEIKENSSKPDFLRQEPAFDINRIPKNL